MVIFEEDELENSSNKKKDKAYLKGNAIDESLRNKASAISHDFGICNKCESFFYIEFELGEYIAKCIYSSNLPLDRTHTKKIKKCSVFYDKGNTPLRDMVNQAWDITTKDKMGFRP